MDSKMYELATGAGTASSDKFSRLDGDSQLLLSNRCGSSMTVLYGICNAHDYILKALGETKEATRRTHVKTAFDYICTAFECQCEGVYDWNAGRETLSSLMIYGFSKISKQAADYILMQILLELETFNYGNVQRCVLAYVMDLFALYFLTYNDWDTYIMTKCDFPKYWFGHSQVVSMLRQYTQDDIFGISSDPQD